MKHPKMKHPDFHLETDMMARNTDDGKLILSNGVSLHVEDDKDPDLIPTVGGKALANIIRALLRQQVAVHSTEASSDFEWNELQQLAADSGTTPEKAKQTLDQFNELANLIVAELHYLNIRNDIVTEAVQTAVTTAGTLAVEHLADNDDPLELERGIKYQASKNSLGHEKDADAE